MPNVVAVLVENGGSPVTNVVPPRVIVAQGNQTITWTAAGPGTVFTSSDYFYWKTSPAPLSGALPTRSGDGKTLTLAYNNTFSVVWEYGLHVENGTSGSVEIDPEIDNGTPP